MKNSKSYLVAANTCEGFVSYFEEFLKPAKRVMILKGGPGCGKSTFMKKVGNTLIDKGLSVDFIYCASDSESLDAIYVNDVDLIIVDGTAPHVIDPKYPGVVESIYNFGEYFDEDILRENGRKIKNIIDTKSGEYKKLYDILREAKIIHDRMEKEYLIGMDFEKANQISTNLVKEVVGESECMDGNEINRFAGALTPQGQAIYYDELLEGIENRYIIKGRAGTGKSTLMKKLGKSGLCKGYEVEFYHCGLDPNSLDMVIIRDLSVAVLDGTAPHVVDPVGNDKVIDMFELCINKDIVDEENGILVDINREYSAEIVKAKEVFKNIKELHEELEGIYTKAINFKEIDKIYDKVIEEILNM
ncbi:MAG: hypothetical protein RSA01_10440 [Clostridium sp.]|uniref:hypothetical protein n=1 Tax=Clostridium sp. TaxID=1506 RepID=UPI002FC590C0